MPTPNKEATVVSERDETVEEAVLTLLNAAVIARTNERGIELECTMCGGRDENHTATCPIPALEEWVNPSILC